MLCGKMAPLMMSCIRHKWETRAECSTEAGIPRVIVTAFYEKKNKNPNLFHCKDAARHQFCHRSSGCDCRLSASPPNCFPHAVA